MKQLLLFALILTSPLVTTGQTKPKGILLEELTWVEAEKLLTKDTVVVIPLVAAAKEHGPHLKLNNDLLIAEYLKKRMLDQSNVVIAPTINYHFYPAFLEYPGSTSLRLETARDLTIDVVKSLARFGPRRFYILNTGISTLRALQPAVESLAKEGVSPEYSRTSKISARRPSSNRRPSRKSSDFLLLRSDNQVLSPEGDGPSPSDAIRHLNPITRKHPSG